MAYSCVQEELVSIRRKFDSGDVIEHLSRKMNKTRAKRVRQEREREREGEGRGKRERGREREGESSPLCGC